MACQSCGGYNCSCGIDTIMMPVAKGDKGDVGATGATGAQGPQGVGALNAAKRLYYRITTPTFVRAIPIADFNNAFLSTYAYNGDTGLFETNIFANAGMFMANLKVYAVANGGSIWYDLTTLVNSADITYSATQITFTVGTPVATRAYQLCGSNVIDYYIVIQG